MIEITAYHWVPPFVRGLVRDLRVRWALTEAGIPYTVRLIANSDAKQPAHRALQPFGQVPTCSDDGLDMFESGAICLHIAGRSDALMPTDDAGRAHTLMWHMAALNSIEPALVQVLDIDLFAPDSAWGRERRPAAEAFARTRLADLAAHLKDRDYLVADRFTVADLTMACTLQMLRHSDIVTSDPVLGPYLARMESRPAYQTALAAQLADFDDTMAPAAA
ncbi:MAG: glutathione S-transferase family protein [Alphaproteobacteria bacterium]|nr:MAG: glutathione S-transferase family protein [Alphaproteobacteria bacterium]